MGNDAVIIGGNGRAEYDSKNRRFAGGEKAFGRSRICRRRKHLHHKFVGGKCDRPHQGEPGGNQQGIGTKDHDLILTANLS